MSQYGGYNNGATDEYQLRARVLGGTLDRTVDLLPSTLIGVLFLLLIGALLYRWRQFDKVRRPTLLIVTSVGLFSTAIGFLIRAALANTALANQSVEGIRAFQILLLIGLACFIDGCITLTRDLFLQVVVFRSHIIFVIVSRILLVTATILSSIAIAALESPQAQTTPMTKRNNLLRLFGALLPFLIITANLFFYVLIGWLVYVPRLYSTLIVIGLNLCQWVPCLYIFVIVAVTNDSPLVTSKLFFYLAFGLFQGLACAVLAALDLRKYFALHGYMAMAQRV